MTMQSILEMFNGKSLAQGLIRQMEETLPDFREARERYLVAVATLSADGSLPVAGEVDAIERQTASTVLFSGALGLVANLENYRHPTYGSFLDAEPEVYLREYTARSLPEYEHAQRFREEFYAMLSPSQREVYEDVAEYVSYLETAGPKLAHYYGYIAGNSLLSQCVPGYHPDGVQTGRYHRMLESYFGHPIA